MLMTIEQAAQCHFLMRLGNSYLDEPDYTLMEVLEDRYGAELLRLSDELWQDTPRQNF